MEHLEVLKSPARDWLHVQPPLCSQLCEAIGNSPRPHYFYFPTRPPTSYDSQDVYCSANEYFVLFLFSVWPLWLIYWKLILPPSAGRINRFLLGFTLLFPTTGPKCFRNINECAVTKPHFELHGFPRPQCTSSHVLGVVVLMLAPPDLPARLLSFAPFLTPWVLLLPTRQDRHPVFCNPHPASLTPTPLCLSFCPLLKSSSILVFWELHRAFSCKLAKASLCIEQPDERTRTSNTCLTLMFSSFLFPSLVLLQLSSKQPCPGPSPSSLRLLAPTSPAQPLSSPPPGPCGPPALTPTLLLSPFPPSAPRQNGIGSLHRKEMKPGWLMFTRLAHL